mmetsp:Transcript_11157/g.23567  ORF Transcript_11157/g.23567 Transcript_11157/m.23567 type:complete len:182 (-) Transcript_11157:57-602(-)
MKAPRFSYSSIHPSIHEEVRYETETEIHPTDQTHTILIHNQSIPSRQQSQAGNQATRQQQLTQSTASNKTALNSNAMVTIHSNEKSESEDVVGVGVGVDFIGPSPEKGTTTPRKEIHKNQTATTTTTNAATATTRRRKRKDLLSRDCFFVNRHHQMLVLFGPSYKEFVLPPPPGHRCCKGS